MKRRANIPEPTPHVIIRVSGKLFRGHLNYLDQLVDSATECQLWPLLSLAQLEELDRDALLYLMDGEKRRFEIVSCPHFVRNQMEDERHRAAA
ncbi:MAG TPA: hypothetical protein VHW45_16260 [Candidatus Sulfotelmatobacter sp.]|jgi:hypothetical protein|nr:hypothetical protein [Candidatus Sulfotelmatobacter sp.]